MPPKFACMLLQCRECSIGVWAGRGPEEGEVGAEAADIEGDDEGEGFEEYREG